MWSSRADRGAALSIAGAGRRRDPKAGGRTLHPPRRRDRSCEGPSIPSVGGGGPGSRLCGAMGMIVAAVSQPEADRHPAGMAPRSASSGMGCRLWGAIGDYRSGDLQTAVIGQAEQNRSGTSWQPTLRTARSPEADGPAPRPVRPLGTSAPASLRSPRSLQRLDSERTRNRGANPSTTLHPSNRSRQPSASRRHPYIMTSPLLQAAPRPDSRHPVPR
jgi:hypothetical protein